MTDVAHFALRDDGSEYGVWRYFFNQAPNASRPLFPSAVGTDPTELDNPVYRAPVCGGDVCDADAIKPLYVADLDGDFLPEIIRGWTPPGETSSSFWEFRRNNPHAPGTFGSYEPFIDAGVALPSTNDANSYVTELDGTSRKWFLTRNPDPNHLVPRMRAFGLSAAGTVLAHDTSLIVRKQNEAEWHYVFLDVNGDGNVDTLKTTNAHWLEPASSALLALNTGSGAHYLDLSEASTSTAARGLEATTCGVRVMDVNEDGLADVVLPYAGTGAYIGNSDLERPYVTALLSNGDHLEATTIYTTGADGVRRPLPASPCDTWAGAPPPTWAVADEMTQVGDVDGDGRTEIVKIVFSAPVGATTVGRVHVLKHQSSRPDALVAVRNGLGLQTTILYEDVRQDAFTFTGACTYPQHCGIHGLVAVAELDVGDPSDSSSFQRTSYDYGSALWDARAEGFLGFTSRTTTNLNTGATTLERFDLATKVGGFHPFLGMPISRETNTHLTDGRILATTTTVDYEVLHEGDLPASATPFSVAPRTQLVRSVERYHGKDTVLAETLTTDTHADPFGGLTHRHVAAVHVGDTYDTDIVYRNDPTRWLLDLESSIKVTHTAPSGQVTHRTKSFDYDLTTGLMSVERRAPDEGSELRKVVRYFYNASGLVTDVMESDAEESRLSSNVYDSAEGMFVTAKTNALGHVVRTVWQPSWGLPVRVIDANGGITDSSYDGFGRLREATTNAHHHGTTHYTRSLGPVTTVSAVDGSGVFAAAYDPLQRLKLRRATGFDGRTVDVSVGYDAAFVDKPAYVARPRFTDESSTALVTTSFQYDLAGRTVAVHEPGGASVTKRYVGLRTTTIDEIGRESFVEIDQLGRISRHVALNGFDSGPFGRPTPHEIETRYFYGRFGALEQINDADGNATTITYDAWGRRIASSDPDTGVGALEYNAFDELTATVDATGSRSTFGHDSLGRLYGETTKDGTTCFAWDSAPHGVGSLAATQSPDGVVTKHAYDGVGRPLATSWTVDGETYTFLNKYDPTANRIAMVAYPRVGGADFGLSFDYAANGDIKGVQDAVSHTVVWQAEQRNAALQLERESFASGVVTSRTYDGDRGFIKNIKTQGPGKHGDVLQSLAFDYFADGRVKRRTDTLLPASSGRIENYTYDQVGRLTDWQVPGVTESAYAYDDINNLLEIRARSLGGPAATTTESFAIGAAGPHQVTSTSAGSYFYDANGNLAESPGRTITSTAFNLPRRIDEGGRVTTFAYDAFGSRVKKTGPEGTTITIGLFERRVSPDGNTTDVAYIPGADRVVAQVTATSRERTTTFLHDDRLGSPVLLTDAAGKVVERRRFDPFGKSVQPDNPAAAVDESESVSLGFTGQPLDHGLDLVNMGGRIYDPKLRRFVSADPIVQAPTSLGLNPYAYVGNDPVNLIDPTGFAETRADAANEADAAGTETEICFGECVDDTGLPVIGKSNIQGARRTSKVFKLDIRLTGNDDAAGSADRQRRQGPTQPDVFQEMGTTPQEYYANHLGDVCYGDCEQLVAPGVFEEDTAIDSVEALNIAYRNGDVSKYCGTCNGNWGDPFMGPHSPLARASYEAKRQHIEARGMVALADKVLLVASAVTLIGAPAAAEAALGAELGAAAEEESSIVYRVIRPGENPAAGLVAKNPAATYTAEGHIINGSRPGWASQYLSTTKELSVAESWAASSGNRIVAIDLAKVTGRIHDVSTGIGLKGITARNFARASAEVLIEGRVPADAILWVK